MIRDVLAHLHWSVLPVVSMMMFFGVFLGVLLWVYRSKSSEIYHQLENLPLEEGGKHE